eukprot:SM000319S12279  [mRNA]  locus=s319:64026:67517:- [translate_table: standard]
MAPPAGTPEALLSYVAGFLRDRGLARTLRALGREAHLADEAGPPEGADDLLAIFCAHFQRQQRLQGQRKQGQEAPVEADGPAAKRRKGQAGGKMGVVANGKDEEATAAASAPAPTSSGTNGVTSGDAEDKEDNDEDEEKEEQQQQQQEKATKGRRKKATEGREECASREKQAGLGRKRSAATELKPKSETAPDDKPLAKAGTAARAFQRVDPTQVEFKDPRLKDNSYWAKARGATADCGGADVGWGAKAQEVLGTVRGKNFRHEKTKKKRGSYRGGAIDLQSHSIKFADSDEE